MFGVFVKHKIFETALDTIFSAISRNFTKSKSHFALESNTRYKSILIANRDSSKSIQQLDNACVINKTIYYVMGESIDVYTVSYVPETGISDIKLLISTEILEVNL